MFIEREKIHRELTCLGNTSVALTSVAQWVEGHPEKQKVSGCPGQGTCLGCSPVPGWGEFERQLTNASLPLFLFPLFSF